MHNIATLLLFSFALVFSTGSQSGASFRASNKKSPFIKVLSKQVKLQEEITFIVNGHLSTTGDCSGTPQLGLIRKNNTSTWDTVIAVEKLGVMLCDLGNATWNNDTITIIAPIPYANKNAKVSGTYCLTFLAVGKGKNTIMASNEFEIKQ